MDVLNILPWLITACALGGAWWWRRRLHQSPTITSTIEEPQASISDYVLDHVDIGILLLNTNGDVVSFNQAATDLLELPAHANGMSLMSLVRDHQFDEFVRHSIVHRERSEMRYAQRPLGRTLHISTCPLQQKNVDYTMVMVRDVTQISQLERARRDMVASVSHELRTPLASLKLLSETIITNPPPEIAQRMARRISEEVDTLTRLVNDLHDLSRIEAGRIALQMSPHAPLHLIERAIERIQPQAETNHIKVTHTITHALPDVLVDAGRIDQVFLNLMHNAVKFTPDHGHITVHAQVINLPHDDVIIPKPPADHTNGEWVLFCVTDTGVGIEKEHLDRVFERFYKVDQARTRGSGTGLGLAITRHLVEGHGGRIWVVSTVGKGTTFAFTLPTA
jgi:two-component system, OmpR family, phosphate regulon sensor histidine kinase PhoR